MSYDVMQQPANYRISVKAKIVRDDGKFMLVREDDAWEFPGGGLEHGEKAAIGLAREIEEETGMKVDRVSDNPIAFWTMSKQLVEGNPAVWFGFVLYDVKIAGEFTPSEEAQEIGYFSHAEAAGMPLQPNTIPYFKAKLK